jgi:hypothetical protein
MILILLIRVQLKRSDIDIRVLILILWPKIGLKFGQTKEIEKTELSQINFNSLLNPDDIGTIEHIEPELNDINKMNEGTWRRFVREIERILTDSMILQ